MHACMQAATLLRHFTTGAEMVLAAAILFCRATDLDDNLRALTAPLNERDQALLQQTLGW